MSRTLLSVIVAATLVAISGGVFLARRVALGVESTGPVGWTVTLIAEGTLQAKDASLSSVRAFDFRRQHIYEERFEAGKELREPVRKKRAATGERKQVWRRQVGRDAPAPFRLEYSFRCSLQARPTPNMTRLTAKVDAPPAAGSYLESTPLIESKDERIIQAAEEQVHDEMPPQERVAALFEFVAGLGAEDTPDSRTAVGCLRTRGGGPLGKTRLLVALCRSRQVPCRELTGLVLGTDGPQQLHHWAEAWADDEWVPLCPTFSFIGAEDFPENYLVLAIGTSQVVTGRGADFRFSVTAESDSTPAGDQRPSASKRFWRSVSLHALHSSEQAPVRFLLLLPLAALIVSIARTLIGIVTFGVFAPALIGLAFLDLRSLPWALPIFVLTVLIGWGIRHALERLHLLQVPRVSALLTLIVIVLLAVIVTASNFGVTSTRYVSLFPLVILTFLVERFWTIEAEDSTATSFKTLLGTLVVSLVVGVALRPDAVRTWMFRYPETLGVILAAQLLIGRYTGYRLTELYRFEDLIKEGPTPGGPHELADPLAAPEGTGHPGDEPPQRGVHPGPEPTPALSPGGYQEPPGRPVHADRRPDA